MILEGDLLAETNNFFCLYWNVSLNGSPPKWSEHWRFNGTIPGNDRSGCYALFKDNEIIYIGVGIAKGGGIYRNSGLGDRLKRYWMVNEETSSNRYAPRADWAELESIITIGFEEKHYFLAAALEVYLIDKLKPIRNSQHK